MKIVINYTQNLVLLESFIRKFKRNDINYCDIIVVIGGYYDLKDYEITKDKI